MSYWQLKGSPPSLADSRLAEAQGILPSCPQVAGRAPTLTAQGTPPSLAVPTRRLKGSPPSVAAVRPTQPLKGSPPSVVAPPADRGFTPSHRQRVSITAQGITTLCRGPIDGSRGHHPLLPTTGPSARPHKPRSGIPSTLSRGGEALPTRGRPCPDVTRTAQAERGAPRSLRLPAWGVPPGHWTAWSLNGRRRATSTVVTAPSIPVGPRCSQRLRAAHTPPRARRLTTHC